jgi:hypothetical protein
VLLIEPAIELMERISISPIESRHSKCLRPKRANIFVIRNFETAACVLGVHAIVAVDARLEEQLQGLPLP